MLQKVWDIISLNILRNNFNDPTKLFSDLYLTEFLDCSAKLFFPYINNKFNSLFIISLLLYIKFIYIQLQCIQCYDTNI